MAIIIKHRVNTIDELKNTPNKFGIEIDIRPYGNDLILHHDPFCEGISLNKFLQNYKHKMLIANIKSEGIENVVINTLQKYGISDYFLLDVSFPFTVKLINSGISSIALRFSEYESIETCLNFKGKAEWVFIDNITHLPIENGAFQTLKKYFKLCIVSPELLGRDEIEKDKALLKDFSVDAILTKTPERWLK